jgi:NAD kinase
MIKITKLNGTQLTTKPAILSEISNDGFVLVDEDGEDQVLTFDSVREYFCEKTVKIKIEEMSKSTLE